MRAEDTAAPGAGGRVLPIPARGAPVAPGGCGRRLTPEGPYGTWSGRGPLVSAEPPASLVVVRLHVSAPTETSQPMGSGAVRTPAPERGSLEARARECQHPHRGACSRLPARRSPVKTTLRSEVCFPAVCALRCEAGFCIQIVPRSLAAQSAVRLQPRETAPTPRMRWRRPGRAPAGSSGGAACPLLVQSRRAARADSGELLGAVGALQLREAAR